MKVLAKKSKRGHRERRSAFRLWSVVYPLAARMDVNDPAGVLITTSDLIPLPVAFVSSNGRNPVAFALRLLRGKASFDEVIDYRRYNWLAVGTCVNGAILYLLDSTTGKPDASIEHLAAAQFSIDPLDHSIRFLTFDQKGLLTYISTQKAMDWAIPRSIAKRDGRAVA